MKLSLFQKERRQNGMALILAIGFLAVLSILGAAVMRVSTQGLKESVSVRPKQIAFYVADRAVEYAMNRDMIYHLKPVPGEDEENLVTATLAPATSSHKDIIEAGEDKIVLDSGMVKDLGESSLPPYMAALHGSDFGANLYHVNVQATSYPTIPSLKETVHVDAAIVRLYKKDDDQIFRTTGGG
jgi:hypothetical protein